MLAAVRRFSRQQSKKSLLSIKPQLCCSALHQPQKRRDKQVLNQPGQTRSKGIKT
ncbi:UNVERIFIED_CONTAM: hypothetical protein FKN15_058558 [Acipenser sinensis]